MVPLVCPKSRQPLELRSLAEAQHEIGTPLRPVRGGRCAYQAAEVLLRADRRGAYPVRDGIAIMMAPEMMVAEDDEQRVDITADPYREPYAQMAFYDRVAAENRAGLRESPIFATIEAPIRSSENERASFPAPREIWIDSVYECNAQWEAYEYLSFASRGGRFLQVGGQGTHALKFLLAGAAEAWLTTPVFEEARCALALAQACGVRDRLRCAIAIAEELPFQDRAFDAVYMGGCLHHTLTHLALPEFARVLRGGGRFAAVAPWQAPLYRVGIKMIGNREPEIHSLPLTRERMKPLWRVFRGAKLVQHGTLTRYPLLALGKLGREINLSTAWKVTSIDDAACSMIPGLRKLGSCVAVLAEK